jgi:hypothetical protein
VRFALEAQPPFTLESREKRIPLHERCHDGGVTGVQQRKLAAALEETMHVAHVVSEARLDPTFEGGSAAVGRMPEEMLEHGPRGVLSRCDLKDAAQAGAEVIDEPPGHLAAGVTHQSRLQRPVPGFRHELAVQPVKRVDVIDWSKHGRGPELIESGEQLGGVEFFFMQPGRATQRRNARQAGVGERREWGSNHGQRAESLTA